MAQVKHYEIKIGSISFIRADVTPITWGWRGGWLLPTWVPKTLIGLKATRNKQPPTQDLDFRQYQRSKDFRAMIFCHFRVSIDAQTHAIQHFEEIDALHDPGWTPPFDTSAVKSAEVLQWFDKDTPGRTDRRSQRP